jgi:hypothetical protein
MRFPACELPTVDINDALWDGYSLMGREKTVIVDEVGSFRNKPE